MATVAWRGVTDRAPCIEQLDLINLLFSAIQATCTLFRGKAHPHPDFSKFIKSKVGFVYLATCELHLPEQVWDHSL